MSNPITILVVDDEPYNLVILQEYLEGAGYIVETADDGVPALEILRAGGDKFSCVLLDRMMPNMDGIELIKHINNDENLKALPVIMQTAAGSSVQIREGIEAGVFYYLIKPFTKDLMLSLVRSAVSELAQRRRLNEQLRHHSVAGYCLDEAHFTFRTIAEVQDIAYTVASWLPEPVRVASGLFELMVNAIEHGNLGITYEEKTVLLAESRWLPEIERRLQLPDNLHKFAELHWKRSDDHISIRIADQGKGFDVTPFLELNLQRLADPHGRGIAVAKALAFDDVAYSNGGTTVTCTVMLPTVSS